MKRGRAKTKTGNYERLSFGLERLRDEKGLTQKQFAEKLQTSKETYIKWEHGVHLPDIERLSQMADTFDCDVDYLIGRTDRKSRDLDTAAEYTGLSPEALEKVRALSINEKNALSQMLESAAVSGLLHYAAGYIYECQKINDFKHDRDYPATADICIGECEDQKDVKMFRASQRLAEILEEVGRLIESTGTTTPTQQRHAAAVAAKTPKRRESRADGLDTMK